MGSVASLALQQDDGRLVRSAVAGETAAFDALVARHAQPVFRLAQRMLGHREEAEDVLQEAFLQAYRKLHTFRGEASFGTWIYAITARLCLSRARRAARRPVEVAEMLDPVGAVDPEAQLAAAAAAARVQETLAKLSPPDRLLIVLKYIEGLGHEEIARILGCSPESSRSRLTRAKRLFREQYEEKDEHVALP